MSSEALEARLDDLRQVCFAPSDAYSAAEWCEAANEGVQIALALLAALAVAREREQRAVDALAFYAAESTYEEGVEPHPRHFATGVVPIEADLGARARAALVDEPEAATRQPHQALGRCRCGACHTLEEAIELNYAAATLAEPEQATDESSAGRWSGQRQPAGAESAPTRSKASASLSPGSASAAADEPQPLTPDEWTLEHATDWRIPSARAAYNRYLEAFDGAAAAADEPGETPA